MFNTFQFSYHILYLFIGGVLIYDIHTYIYVYIHAYMCIYIYIHMQCMAKVYTPLHFFSPVLLLTYVKLL